MVQHQMQAKVGRQKDFEAALQRLRGKNADISEEKDEIQVHTPKPCTPVFNFSLLMFHSIWRMTRRIVSLHDRII